MTETTPLLAALAQSLDRLTPGTNDLTLDMAGMPLNLRVHFNPDARDLLIRFHGAVDRTARKLPAFSVHNKTVAGLCTEVLVADPTLHASDTLSMGWFTGTAAAPAQSALTSVFAGIAQKLGSRRRIYFGTSVGGFAALYYSFQDAGSHVLTVNPQTSIAKYYKSHRDAYRLAAWPGAARISDIPAGTVTNLCSLYKKNRNTIIYLQNLSDRHHVQHHMMPWVGAYAKYGNPAALILESGYWGYQGHDWRGMGFTPWIRAICLHDDTQPGQTDLIRTWHELRAQPVAAPATARRGAAAARPDFDPADLQISNRLRLFSSQDTRDAKPL